MLFFFFLERVKKSVIPSVLTFSKISIGLFATDTKNVLSILRQASFIFKAFLTIYRNYVSFGPSISKQDKKLTTTCNVSHAVLINLFRHDS